MTEEKAEYEAHEPADHITEQDVDISKKMQGFASAFHKFLGEEYGRVVPFAIVVFSDSQTQYVSNAVVGDVMAALKQVVENYEAGLPATPPHEREDVSDEE